MIFRSDVLAQAPSAYDALSEYFRDIRAFYEVISVRFAIPEYGVRLTPVAGNELHSNANSYLLSDNSSYPFYLWLPTWLGRFYIDPESVPPDCSVDDCPTDKAGLIAFVWPWLGFNDAYVKDADGPECWFGVADPRPDDPHETVSTTATSLFNYFRVERTLDDEKDGWATGTFAGRDIGCNLTGRWHLRRAPMTALTSYYEVERNIIRPLGEKFTALATAANA
ncbi:hypothetical protein ABZ545_02890 [Streptomyces abikoensis]|uniref:Uncharacterized protein n=2 Tax=Streptomyces TaxID=1883 RepID=A0A3S9PDV5_STRLT|nr:hypothetical protein [Streptomyces luteoverticillatus]AZQ70538.1 hypothetical protein EKH77_04295 [Streptomyces luteoverticillatus]